MDDEMSFAKRLAHSSDPEIRDKTARMLGMWLAEHKTADEHEYMRLWKALYYTVWHSDKVPVQQELAFRLARLLHELKGDHRRALLFCSTLLATLQREWITIDRYRLDKFMSLIRRFMGEALRYAQGEGWDAGFLSGLAGVWGKYLGRDTPAGIRFHLTDVLLEEIACITPKIPTSALLALLAPFWAHLGRTDDRFVYERVLKELGKGLLRRLTARFGKKKESADGAEDGPQEPTPEEEDEAADESKLVGGSGGRANPLMVPLLDDRKARLAAGKQAFVKIDVAAVARAIFSLACDAATQDGHRPALYELHTAFAALAVEAGHAKTSKETYPALKAPAAAAEGAGGEGDKVSGKRARAVEAEEEEAATLRPPKKAKLAKGTVVPGVQRAAEEAAQKKGKVASKKVPVPVEEDDDEDIDDDEDEAAMAAAVAATLAQKKGGKGAAAGKGASAPSPHVKFATGTKPGALTPAGKSKGGKKGGK